MQRIRSFFLFVWRMISPLIVYELISELVYTFLFLIFMYRYSALLYTTAGAIAALIPLIIWYKKWDAGKEAQKDPTPKYSLQLPDVLKLSVLGMCLCVSLNILALYVPVTWEEYDMVGSQIYREPVFMQLICVGLIVPFAEETVFRGLGYRRMRTMIPAVWAVLISSLFFGLFHGNIIQGLYAGVLGIFMAAAVERYKTIMASYVIHASANMMSVFLTGTIVNELINFVTPFRLAALVISGAAAAALIIDIRKKAPVI